MKIDKRNYSRLWTNAEVFNVTPDAVFASSAGDKEYAITFSIDDEVSSSAPPKTIKILSKRASYCVLSIVYADGIETRRLNIAPFYKDETYLMPLSIFDDKPYQIIKEIRLHIKGLFELESIEIGEFPVRPISLKIMLHSGIGDCLRALMRNSSITSFAQKYPCEIYWAYAGRGLRDSKWEGLLDEFILGRNQLFRHITIENYEELDSCELFNGYSGDVLFSGYLEHESDGIEINLFKNEMQKVDDILKYASFRIGVQLQGNDPKKLFPPEKWVHLFTSLLSKYPLSNIYILDSPMRSVDQAMLFDSRIINLIGITNIAQNINLIQKMDLWISPDSFSKYVAAWSDVRQVVMCCRLPYNEPREMLISAFDIVGLLNKPRIKLVGIDFNKELEVASIVDDVRDIEVAQVLSFC